METLLQHLQQRINARSEAHLLRVKYAHEGTIGATIQVNGSRYLCFASNDYLGHAGHAKVQAALTQSAQSYGVGGGASHVICGHHKEHQKLEETFADYLGRDKAILFSNGYMANLAIITSLLDKNAAVFEDKLNHASLLDAGLMSGARFQRFLHNDSNDLVKRLNKSKAEHRMICSESVFSMDGDLCDVKTIAPLAKQHNALFMLDDAHGFGVLGDNGLGIIDRYQLSQDELPLVMITLGKAIGTFGAIVAGHKVLIDTIAQFARPYIYTTSLPPCIASAALASLTLLREESWRRKHLTSLISFFKKEAKLSGLPVMPSDTAIQPVFIGDDKKSLQWQSELKQAGILVNAIRPPTIPRGTSRLRITLSASHTFDDVERLLTTLDKINKKEASS